MIECCFLFFIRLGPAMERLLRARKEGPEVNNKSNNDEFIGPEDIMPDEEFVGPEDIIIPDDELADTAFVGPEDILPIESQNGKCRDDVSCITNPTYAGGMFLREVLDDSDILDNDQEILRSSRQAYSISSHVSNVIYFDK